MQNPAVAATDPETSPASNAANSPVLTAAAMTRRAEKSLETRTRILDAAEEQFSKRGIDGVTLRDIAQVAEVDTALLHYYFDSKQGIFDAVLARRAAILHYETTESLSRYEREASGAPTVEGAVSAFLRPIFRLGRTGGREWRNYCSLVLQMGNSEWSSNSAALYFEPIAVRLLELLRRALPAAADDDLHWSYQMLSRMLTLAFTLDESIERLSNGRCRAGDFDALEPRMMRFAAAGILAACSARGSAATEA